MVTDSLLAVVQSLSTKNNKTIKNNKKTYQTHHFHVVDAVILKSDSWSQASLPVSLGGLGFRAATQLATSCYLSSAAAARDLVSLIFSPFFFSC